MNNTEIAVDEKTLVDLDLEDTTYDETSFVDEENDFIFNPNTHNDGSDKEDGSISNNRIPTIPILHSDVGCSLPDVDDFRLSSGNVKKHSSFGNSLTNIRMTTNANHPNDTAQQFQQQQTTFRTFIVRCILQI